MKRKGVTTQVEALIEYILMVLIVLLLIVLLLKRAFDALNNKISSTKRTIII